MWYLYRYSYVYDKDGQFTYHIFMDTVITGKPYCGITRSPWDLQIRKQATLHIKQEVKAMDEAGATIQV